MESTIISPSAEARKIYNMMVTRADDNDSDGLHLSLAQSIELAVTLSRRGEDCMASTAVAELRDADWIVPVDSGGWKIA
jgi:hypothetical protein